jgi:hypothetical protein
MLSIVILGLLTALKGCQDYDLDVRCIKATGAVCVEAPL